MEFALDILNRDNEIEITNRNILKNNLQKAFNSCLERIDNLIRLYISPENTSRELLSDEEFKNEKSTLLKEKANVQSELNKLNDRVDEWIALTEKSFKFATYASFWFATGNYETKAGILRALGSDFFLKDRKLEVSLQKQYSIIQNGAEKIRIVNATLGLNNFSIEKAKTAPSRAVFDIVSGIRESDPYFNLGKVVFCH